MAGAIILFRKAEPTGPSNGESVNHIGMVVPGLAPYYRKLDAGGYKYRIAANNIQALFTGPGGVGLELIEDASATVPLRFHHVHFNTPKPLEIQAWYAGNFGAVPGKRILWDAGDIPGANLTFGEGKTGPTAGRAIDHIGFEVKNLEAFCQKLTESGVKLDSPYRQVPNLGIALAFLTDPWGTRIELTEGLGN